MNKFFFRKEWNEVILKKMLFSFLIVRNQFPGPQKRNNLFFILDKTNNFYLIQEKEGRIFLFFLT